MTRTDYAVGMSRTPSDPDYINTKALERFMGHFDHVLWGKTNPKVDGEVGNPFPNAADRALRDRCTPYGGDQEEAQGH